MWSANITEQTLQAASGDQAGTEAESAPALVGLRRRQREQAVSHTHAAALLTKARRRLGAQVRRAHDYPR